MCKGAAEGIKCKTVVATGLWVEQFNGSHQGSAFGWLTSSEPEAVPDMIKEY